MLQSISCTLFCSYVSICQNSITSSIGCLRKGLKIFVCYIHSDICNDVKFPKEKYELSSDNKISGSLGKKSEAIAPGKYVQHKQYVPEGLYWYLV